VNTATGKGGGSLECHYPLDPMTIFYCGLNKDDVTNLIIVQQDATYSVYYIPVGRPTCFGC